MTVNTKVLQAAGLVADYYEYLRATKDKMAYCRFEIYADHFSILSKHFSIEVTANVAYESCIIKTHFNNNKAYTSHINNLDTMTNIVKFLLGVYSTLDDK